MGKTPRTAPDPPRTAPEPPQIRPEPPRSAQIHPDPPPDPPRTAQIHPDPPRTAQNRPRTAQNRPEQNLEWEFPIPQWEKKLCFRQYWWRQGFDSNRRIGSTLLENIDFLEILKDFWWFSKVFVLIPAKYVRLPIITF